MFIIVFIYSHSFIYLIVIGKWMTYYIIDTNYPTSQRRVNKILNYVKKSLVDVLLMTF